jgi:hypothetical protein
MIPAPVDGKVHFLVSGSEMLVKEGLPIAEIIDSQSAENAGSGGSSSARASVNADKLVEQGEEAKDNEDYAKAVELFRSGKRKI